MAICNYDEVDVTTVCIDDMRSMSDTTFFIHLLLMTILAVNEPQYPRNRNIEPAITFLQNESRDKCNGQFPSVETTLDARSRVLKISRQLEALTCK